MKILITGNSGSGKTWLAKRIAPQESTLIHLDTIFWKPGGFDEKRKHTEIEELIAQSLQNKHWVAEGVFGDLANRYVPEASELIWLDMPWELCRKRPRLMNSTFMATASPESLLRKRRMLNALSLMQSVIKL